MNKEIKYRLIAVVLAVLFTSLGYYLGGEWRNIYYDNGVYTTGEPIFEFTLRDGSCGENCLRAIITSNDALIFMGMFFFFFGICPMRFFADQHKLEEKK